MEDDKINKLIWISIILLVVFVSFDIYLFFGEEETPPEIKVEEETVQRVEEKKELNVKSDMFENIDFNHWDHMPLTYFIENEDECPEYKRKTINQGIIELERVTSPLIYFQEGENVSADIVIKCIDLEEEIQRYKKCKRIEYPGYKLREDVSVFSDGHLDFKNQIVYSLKLIEKGVKGTSFELCYMNRSEITFSETIVHDLKVYGESRSHIIDRIIKNITINHYYHSGVSCLEYPTLEIKELLHSFGFASSSRSKDILNPLLDGCSTKKEIDAKYISCLRHIYSNGKEKTLSGCTGVRFLGSL